MNAHSSFETYEQFEAALVRELGLSMSLERLKTVTGTWRPKGAFTALAEVTVLPKRADFESRYRECETAAARQAFVRANKAEARAFLRSNAAPTATSRGFSDGSAPRAVSKFTRRRYK